MIKEDTSLELKLKMYFVLTQFTKILTAGEPLRCTKTSLPLLFTDNNPERSHLRGTSGHVCWALEFSNQPALTPGIKQVRRRG